MLYIKGETFASLIRTNHDYRSAYSYRISKFIPYIRIVQAYVRKANCCLRYLLLNSIDCYVHVWILIHSVRVETRIL